MSFLPPRNPQFAQVESGRGSVGLAAPFQSDRRPFNSTNEGLALLHSAMAKPGSSLFQQWVESGHQPGFRLTGVWPPLAEKSNMASNMAHDVQVESWRQRLKEVGLRLQRGGNLSSSEYQSLKADHREIERIIQSLTR